MLRDGPLRHEIYVGAAEFNAGRRRRRRRRNIQLAAEALNELNASFIQINRSDERYVVTR